MISKSFELGRLQWGGGAGHGSCFCKVFHPCLKPLPQCSEVVKCCWGFSVVKRGVVGFCVVLWSGAAPLPAHPHTPSVCLSQVLRVANLVNDLYCVVGQNSRLLFQQQQKRHKWYSLLAKLRVLVVDVTHVLRGPQAVFGAKLTLTPKCPIFFLGTKSNVSLLLSFPILK